MNRMAAGKTQKKPPLYARVKSFILEEIATGKLKTDARVPSEHDLVAAFGVSRMTANRALRELTAEGLLIRVPGVGTFVARTQRGGRLHTVRDIAKEIAGRGAHYNVSVIAHEKIRPPLEISRWMGLEQRRKVFFSHLVHREDGRPVQLERRLVSPKAAPDYGSINPHETTPAAYLLEALPLQHVEHVVRAAMPEPETRDALAMSPKQPCLILERRTWSNSVPVSFVEFFHDAQSYCLSESFAPSRSK